MARSKQTPQKDAKSKKPTKTKAPAKPAKQPNKDEANADQEKRPKKVPTDLVPGIPLSSVPEPHDLVFVGSAWSSDEAVLGQFRDVVKSPQATHDTTIFLLTVSNSGDVPKRAFDLLPELGLEFVCVWKTVLLRPTTAGGRKPKEEEAGDSSGGEEEEAAQPQPPAKRRRGGLAVKDRGVSYLAHDGFVHPSTMGVWLVRRKDVAVADIKALRAKDNEPQELYTRGAGTIVDLASDYFNMTPLLLVGVRSNKENSVVLQDGSVRVGKKPTLANSRKTRLFSTFLQSRTLSELRAVKPYFMTLVNLKGIEGEPEDVEEREEIRNEFFEFMPSPKADWNAFKAYIIEASVKTRFSRRLTRLVSANADPNKPKKPRQANGIALAHKVEPKLLDFLKANFTAEQLNLDEEERIARTHVVKLINTYAKEKALQVPEKKNTIKLDDVLLDILNPETPTIKYTDISRLLSPYYPSKKRTAEAMDQPSVDASADKETVPE